MKKFKIDFRSLVLLLFFFLILGITSPEVFGAGSREDPILVARELIFQRKYNEAIAILSEVIQTEPERIDEAEQLLRTIREIRDTYNDLGRQLVDTLENDPENFDRAVSLIDRMVALDDSPNPRTQEQLSEARRTAKLQVDRAQRDSIFEVARAAIAATDYNGAIDLYLSGLQLQRPEFLIDGYSQEIYQIAQDAVEQIALLAQSGKEFLVEWSANLPSFAETFQSSIGGVPVIPQEPGELNWAFSGSVEAFFETQTQATGDLLSQGATYLEAFFEIPQELERAQQLDPRLIDHLVFLQQFVRGQDENPDEGIAGLLQILRRNLSRDLFTNLGEVAQSYLEQSQVSYENNQFVLAARQGQQAFEVALVGIQLDRSFGDSPLVPELELLGFQGMLYHTQAAFEDSYESLITADEQVLEPLPVNYIESLTNYRNLWNRVQERYVSLTQELRPLTEDISLESFETWYQNFENRIIEKNRVQLAGSLQYYEEDMDGYLATLDELNREAQILIEGTQNDEGLIFRYPDRAEELLVAGLEIQADASRVQEEIRLLFEDFPELASINEALEGLRYFSQAQTRQNQLTSLQGQLLADAQQRIAESLDLRDLGATSVAQSRNAIRVLNLDLARDRFEDARVSYYQSLELQEDEEFRSQVDQLILVLGDEIRAAQNELIVNQVRDLLNQGRASYNRGDFNDALALVTEAEELWAITNTVPNQELVTLKDRISSATTLSQERELSEFDPLYPTVSQFLNLARLDIEAGTGLLRGGNRVSAEIRFQNAETNIENILFVKPFNFEARILQIQITQITRESEFQELFARRYSDTIARINTSAPIEILTELQVLARFNPRYPGLQQNIQTLEIRLGLREDPLTRAKIDESNRLLAQARNLSGSAADQASLTAALSLVEQAVILNRDNSQAQLLADTLRIRLGGQASFALSSGDEQLFRRAENLFVQGSIAEAYAIVLQLLQSNTNQGYPPLISLRDRIERRL
ncbi:MAG: hypothetical protein GW949_06790 [Spirochaetales bacterium]|nr:hypothetical protein [Spirochaetales bacterium]